MRWKRCSVRIATVSRRPIFEPLVLGAGGMKMYPPRVLAEIAKICRHYGVWLILDEVMTGFGRTGTLFACEQAGVAPDLMCLSKGITGGFLPMGATLASDEIYDAFYSPDRAQTFFHSSSYTGQCDRLRRGRSPIWISGNEEPVLARIAAIGEYHAGALKRIGAAGRRLRPSANPERSPLWNLNVPDPGYLAGLGPRSTHSILRHNVLLRPLGNVVYVLPPYCAGPAELDADL